MHVVVPVIGVKVQTLPVNLSFAFLSIALKHDGVRHQNKPSALHCGIYIYICGLAGEV